ncbi:MAG: hypothetical protein OXF46_04785 [Rhodobacteraceae bacterium]|nr:hypothetical protein [Paracoccaceae bacterium]
MTKHAATPRYRGTKLLSGSVTNPLARVCTQIIRNMLYHCVDEYTTNGGFDV